MGVGGLCHAPAALTREKPGTHCIGGPQRRSKRVRNISPHKDSIPDRPACGQSLHRASYPGPQQINK